MTKLATPGGLPCPSTHSTDRGVGTVSRPPLGGTGPRPVAALFGDTGPGGETIQQIYGPRRLETLCQKTHLFPEIIDSDNLETYLPALKDLEVIFATWGMFKLSRDHLARMPRLKAVFYAAGTVKYFAGPFLERGITVVSSWAANAVPVAEFTLGQILLANKGYFRNLREYAGGEDYGTASRGQGNYDATIALLGAGQIGRKVIELLKPFRVRILVFDPYLAEADAASLGVEKVGLAEAFRRGQVVSNHLACLPATNKLLRSEHFQSMLAGATFVNTGRGGTVDERALARVLAARPDLTALLDVTDPEPCPRDSPLHQLPNVHITAHIAGSIGTEVGRVADYALEEFHAWLENRPLRYAVNSQMLETMA